MDGRQLLEAEHPALLQAEQLLPELEDHLLRRRPTAGGAGGPEDLVDRGDQRRGDKLAPRHAERRAEVLERDVESSPRA